MDEKKGTEKVSCDICDTFEEVNKYCLTCKQNFCDNCKKGHLRTTFAKDHMFAPVGEGRLADECRNKMCSIHGEECQFYCKTCACATCSVCLSEKHLDHHFCVASQQTSEIKQELMERLARKENELEEIKRELENFPAEISKCRKQSDINVRYIKKTISSWMESLRLCEEDLIEEIQNVTNKEIMYITERKEVLKSRQNDFLNDLKDITMKLRMLSDTALLDQHIDLISRIEGLALPKSIDMDREPYQIALRQTCKEELKYILKHSVSEFKDSSMKSMDSKVSEELPSEEPESLEQVKIEPLIEVMRCDLEESIFGIAPISENRAWLGTRSDIVLVANDGKILLRNLHGMRGTSVTSLPSGDALYVSRDSVISKIEIEGKVSEFINIHPKTINFMKTSTVRDILYVATNQCLMRISLDGVIRESIPCIALSFCELSNGDLMAITHQRDIVLISNDGNDITLQTSVKWSWSRFVSTLASTSQDHILLGDPFGRHVYVYKRQGETMELHKEYMVEMENSGIYTITTDKQDRVWIGTPWDGVIITMIPE